jgi:hypothetical protein
MNAENQYTGVLMGAVGKENNSAKTGLYGFQNGELRYKLDENGDFYVGTGDNNKIEFSDSKLTINTEKFILKAGTTLYLGSTAEENTNAWLRFSDKVYFRNDGTATIGGWSIKQYCIENSDTSNQ